MDKILVANSLQGKGKKTPNLFIREKVILKSLVGEARRMIQGKKLN